jgi:hypothetical protein
MSDDLIGGPCRRCGQQGVFDCCSDETETITSHSEAEKLREAIRDAGFSVMQTSGRWSIHDVSKLADAEREKTNQVISENIDLEIKVSKFEAAIKDAFELFKAADAERLEGTDDADAEAEKWKSEGDMYGWNFHKGKSGGMTEASIIFYRVFRRLKLALK